MSPVSLQDLLEAGTHFGHQTKRWNPKMKRYILCPRNGIYIVDLNKTLQGLDRFLARVREEVRRGGKVLFVGTKRQIKDCVREEAERCGMPFVTERWLGGMLTNFQTIRQSIKKLEKIETMEVDGTFEALPKKEALALTKQKQKLLMVLSGIRNVKRLPALVYVVDTLKEHIAIAEARRLRIPIGAIVDTNCDPEEIAYPIAGNDDALKSVSLITKAVADVIAEASGEVSSEEMTAEAEPAPAEKPESEEQGKENEPKAEEEPVRKRRVVRKKMVEQSEED